MIAKLPILDPRSSILDPRSSILDPRSSILNLDQTWLTQPALFALEYALAELWRSWGIVPAAVLGHSVGEYVAACVAGVFSLEDGLRLIAERGRLMQGLDHKGAMAAVFAEEELVREAAAPYAAQLSIAAVNSPREIVVSGSGEAVEALLEHMQTAGIKTRRLTVSHAFHSPLMEPILDDLEAAAAGLRYRQPEIALISNLTGQPVSRATPIDAGYWRRQAREPVRFTASIQALYERGYNVFLELGPAPLLIKLGQHGLPRGAGTWLASLCKGADDWKQMLTSLGSLYTIGAAVDWNSLGASLLRASVSSAAAAADGAAPRPGPPPAHPRPDAGWRK